MSLGGENTGRSASFSTQGIKEVADTYTYVYTCIHMYTYSHVCKYMYTYVLHVYTTLCSHTVCYMPTLPLVIYGQLFLSASLSLVSAGHFHLSFFLSTYHHIALKLKIEKDSTCVSL